MRAWIGLFISFNVAVFLSSVGEASQWGGFSGIYIGMPAAEAKAKGFTDCSNDFGELCGFAGDTITTYYGERIKNVAVGIRNGKVSTISFEAADKVKNKLLNKMLTRLGRPSAGSSPNILKWKNGAITITLNKFNSNVFYERTFLLKVQ